MKRLIATYVVIFLPAFGCAAEHTAGGEPYPHIMVTGNGFVEAEPDIATLNISIAETAPTMQQAKEAVDRLYEAVVVALRGAGVPDEDIQGARIRANKDYEWGDNKRTYKGERVTRPMTVTLKDTDKYGEVLQVLVDEGISTIDHVTLSFSDEPGLRRQALGKAMDNARENAEFLAGKAGRKLGEVYRIADEGVTGPTPYPVRTRMAAAGQAMMESAPPEEMFGTQRISATVSVEFGLE